jgi:subtilisin family serine protease
MHRLIAPALAAVFLVAFPLSAERRTPLKGSAPERLLELASKRAKIGVIVGVRDEQWQPEGRLTAAQKAAQRARSKEKKAKVLRAHPQAQLIPERDFVTVPFFMLVVDERALRGLMNDDDVASIEENMEGEVLLAESTDRIGSDDANAAGWTGDGQIIVIIDGGVESGHDAFNGRVRQDLAACFSGDLYPGIDEFQYLSFCPCAMTNPETCPGPVTEQFGTGAGEPCGSTNNACRHGTRVAGVAGGEAALGISNGVAPEAEILPIMVMSRNSANTPKFMKSNMAKALDYVAVTADTVSGIAAVNMSLAFPLDWYTDRSSCDTEHSVIAGLIGTLTTKKIAVVVATGNDGKVDRISAPSCITGAIAVSATDDNDAVPSWANAAPIMDLFAPGVSILTAQPPNTSLTDLGTSMAAPHVAGAFALMRQKFGATPSVAALLNALVQTGDSVTDTRTGASTVKPRLRVDLALSASLTPPPTPTGFSATGVSETSAYLSWNASAGATSYRLELRAYYQSPWNSVITTSNTSYTTPNYLANRTVYEFRVIAIANGVESAPANDYALMMPFTDDPLNAPNVNGGSLIRGIHMGELREGADRWINFTGGAWVFPNGHGAATGVVSATHITDVVDALNDARDILNLSAFSFSGVDAPAQTGLIRREHVQQLRDAMK